MGTAIFRHDVGVGENFQKFRERPQLLPPWGSRRLWGLCPQPHMDRELIWLRWARRCSITALCVQMELLGDDSSLQEFCLTSDTLFVGQIAKVGVGGTVGEINLRCHSLGFPVLSFFGPLWQSHRPVSAGTCLLLSLQHWEMSMLELDSGNQTQVFILAK